MKTSKLRSLVNGESPSDKVVFPLIPRGRLLEEAPALADLAVFDSVKVDLAARVALMRSLSGYENEGT